jgi:hypothetical protein
MAESNVVHNQMVMNLIRVKELEDVVDKAAREELWKADEVFVLPTCFSA